MARTRTYFLMALGLTSFSALYGMKSPASNSPSGSRWPNSRIKISRSGSNDSAGSSTLQAAPKTPAPSSDSKITYTREQLLSIKAHLNRSLPIPGIPHDLKYHQGT